MKFAFLILIGIVLTGKFAILNNAKNHEVEKIAEFAVSKCTLNNTLKNGSDGCYVEVFENLSLTYGSEKSFLILEKVQKLDASTKLCHFIAHGIGWGIYKRNKDSISELSHANPTCSYGAQMGIIELWREDTQAELTKEIIPKICGNLSGKCNHGVGHLLLIETEGNVDEALMLCEGLSERKERIQCFKGVFMENITVISLAKHGYIQRNWTQVKVRGKRLIEMENTCNSFNGDKQEACWAQIVQSSYFHFGQNITKVLEHCENAPTLNATKGCKIWSLSIIFGFERRPKNFFRHCENLEVEKECYLTLMDSLVFNTPKNEEGEARKFCNLLKNYNKECLEGIGISIKNKHAYPYETE